MKKTKEKKEKSQFVTVKDSAGNEVVTERGFKGLKKTFRFYKKYMGLFVLMIVFSLLGSGLSVLSPVFEGNMVDQFTKFNVDKIFYYACLSFTVLVLVQTVYTFWYMILIKLNKNVKNLLFI